MDDASLAVMEKNGASNTAGSWLMAWISLAGSLHYPVSVTGVILGYFHLWKGINDHIPCLAFLLPLHCRIHPHKPYLAANPLLDFAFAP